MVMVFILLGLLPSFAWLFFFLEEDLYPEPKKMIAKVFVYGSLVTLLAIVLQLGFRDILKSLGAGDYYFISFLIFGTVEEVLKFLTAWLAVRKSKFFDEPVDAMIYMIVAALGFALVENLAVALSSGAIQEAIATLILRFVGATLLHALSSAVVGYYWALGILRKREGRTSLIIIKGLILASVLHAIFNYLIISLRDVFIYPTIFLILISFFVFWDFERIKVSDTNYE